MEAGEIADLRIDRPLRPGEALEADSLDRKAFAARVAEVLRRVSPQAGLVVAVEGPWGSGKTSVLAMVEAILGLEQADARTVVVHFNPWLIGDRDALLRQFLASIAKAVQLTEHAKEGKRVAKELKTYAKAFDVLKLIPGAEPWASIVKSVVESVGDASEAVFDYKTPDIEARKDALDSALRKFPRRIVVLLDDLDRLYPAEAYEMVRIIKAVGELSNVGYVLAWDEKYVSAALDKLGVPFAGSYLDKVVQVRLPIPPLSFPQCAAMMDRCLERLPRPALDDHFPNGDGRVGWFFHQAQHALIEQPRDVVRLFDIVAAIEPALRGELHLADIIGLATLMTKAPAVYDLLCRSPQAFVGRRPGATNSFEKREEVVETYAHDRNAAIDACGSPKAVRDVVHWLFPLTAKADDVFTMNGADFLEGHLAHPDRLLVALQLSARPGDLSLVRVRQYVFNPAQREEITATLESDNCSDFVMYLGSMAEGLDADVEIDTESLAVAVARLVESPPFVQAADKRRLSSPRVERVAEHVIGQMAKRSSEEQRAALAEKILADEVALTMAAVFAASSFLNKDGDASDSLKVPEDRRDRCLSAFAMNVERAARANALFSKLSPGWVLWVLARLVPAKCRAVFQAIQSMESTLDRFVCALLADSFDSTNGQRYRLPKERDLLESFIAIDDLRKRAVERLKDDKLEYPLKAAWRAVVEDRSIYGKDGSLVRD